MIINTVEKAVTKLPQIQLDSGFSPRDIAYMILAGGTSQTLYHLDTGAHQRAIDFLCCETAAYPEYPLRGGIIVEDEKGRPCLRKGTASFPANEHWNEILGILAMAGAHFQRTPIRTPRGMDGTLLDLAETAMETFRETHYEPGWSLMLFSVYPGVTEEWINEIGEVWSVERILKRAIHPPYGRGICFGTHLLQGITFALSRYCLDQDVEPSRLNGTWSQAWQYVRGALSLMRRNQGEDGALKRSWFRKGAVPTSASEITQMARDFWSRRVDLPGAIVYPSGHCLSSVSPLFEFLDSDRGWLENCCYLVAQTLDLEWPRVFRDIHSVTQAVYALKQTGM